VVVRTCWWWQPWRWWRWICGWCNRSANGNGGAGTLLLLQELVTRAGGGGAGDAIRLVLGVLEAVVEMVQYFKATPLVELRTQVAGGGGVETLTMSGNAGSGGSGIVIIKVPDTVTATFSGGVTSSLSTSVSGFNIYSVTATSTTGETVTFAPVFYCRLPCDCRGWWRWCRCWRRWRCWGLSLLCYGRILWRWCIRRIFSDTC
jgi:hypothetical protein